LRLLRMSTCAIVNPARYAQAYVGSDGMSDDSPALPVGGRSIPKSEFNFQGMCRDGASKRWTLHYAA